MTDDQISDLKLFMTTMIRSEVSAALEEKLETKLEEKFEQKLAPIHHKIDELTAFVQDAITTSNDVNQDQLDAHEVRITRLEKTVA